jgi:hypothetical protein
LDPASPSPLAVSAPGGLAVPGSTGTSGKPRYTEINREHLARRARGPNGAVLASGAATDTAADSRAPALSVASGAAAARQNTQDSDGREYEYAEAMITHAPDSGSGSEDEDETSDGPAGSGAPASEADESAGVQRRIKPLSVQSIRRPRSTRLLAPENRKSYLIRCVRCACVCVCVCLGGGGWGVHV